MSGENWSLKYFSFDELKCKGSGGLKLAAGFGDAIDALREAWGRPLIVTSCCRSAEYNRKVGGHPRSLHVYDVPFHPTGGCCAIDVTERSELFRALAWELGFSIGRATGFTHLDTRLEVLGKTKVIYDY